MEVLLVMAFLSVMILPFTLLLSQSSGLSKGTYIQSTKNTFFSSAADQMDGTRQDYVAAFHDTTMDTSLAESGQTLPVMNIVDFTNTDAFTKVSALYYYTNTTDSTNSPKSSMAEYKTTDVVRMRCGLSTALLDSANQLWWGDQAYVKTAANEQPGYFVTGTTSSSATNVANTPAADDPIFQNWRESTTGLDYRFDVPAGDYNVQLYFAEMSGSATTRYMNIVLEGTQVNTGVYSPYAATGNNYYVANIQSYDVTVSDGVLNININKDGTAGSNPRISGIVVKKLQIQP